MRFLAAERLAEGRIRKSGWPRIGIQMDVSQEFILGAGFHEKTVMDS
jgi:hypothetical protein